ncbi:MAG TPA: polyprenyl synthetase family protein [Bacteroidia bacterium]|nr:polyprenyl synthetase family protein [Bacteroidia bacterium]
MENYKPLLELFNAHLNSYLKELDKKQPRELYDPENYILSLGGKRIRPLLALIGCDLFDKNPSHSLNAALSVELFHNFSLIHDDILDKAPLRRGMPTVHSKWNTDIAILSGDVMLVKAFDVLKNYEATKLSSLLNLFASTSIEVCEGQQMDMNFETQQNVSVNDYLQMITYKTAVLLGCSLKMGAICAEADTENQNHLYEFGKHLGIAFQLMDDVLDAYADDGKFGNQVGGDIIANKKTFLLLKAFELADAAQKNNLTALLNEKDSTLKVKGVLNVYDQLNIKNISEKEADIHTQEALKHLKAVTASESKKKELERLAMQLLNRQS